jgi:hypothetical protein
MIRNFYVKLGIKGIRSLGDVKYITNFFFIFRKLIKSSFNCILLMKSNKFFMFDE